MDNGRGKEECRRSENEQFERNTNEKESIRKSDRKVQRGPKVCTQYIVYY
jgi:hypothetical protein